MFRLDPEIEKLLDRFERGAKTVYHEIIGLGMSIEEKNVTIQEVYRIVFDNFYVDVFETLLTKKSKGWRALFLSLSGSVGMISCVILSYSKLLGKEPDIIYFDKHKLVDIAEITSEWYRTSIDIDKRMKTHEAFGYEVKKKIQFKDVLDEARKFLREMVK
jgi:hypothetical protein